MNKKLINRIKKLEVKKEQLLTQTKKRNPYESGENVNEIQ